jgi:uncharacterized damage-inducible protein DinB
MEEFGRRDAPQAPRAPSSYFQGILTDLRIETREVLAGLEDDDMAGKRVWVDPADPGTQEIFTVGWILQHVFAHESHHQGQIALIRRLLAGDPARAR